LENSGAVLNAISAIYAVPGNAAVWPNVLRELTEMTGSTMSAYQSADVENTFVDITATWNIPEENIRLYKEELAAHDIRLHYADNLVPGTVFREFEFIPDREIFDKNKLVWQRLTDHGTYYCLAAKVKQHRLSNDFIFVNRLKSRGPYTDEEKQALQDVLPHLSRATELHRKFTFLNDRFGAVLGVLDKLLVGLVILDDKGRIVVANESARRTCDNTRSLKLTADGTLQATDEITNRLLQQFITLTGATAVGDGKAEGGQISIARRNGRLPLILEAMPIRDDGLPDSDSVRGSAVFIIDPDRSEILSVDGLSKMFGLTLAEQRVAASIVNGLTVDQVADNRGTTSGTVRSQIKTIFSKTGTNSQSALVRLAANATPPIEPDEH